MHLPVNRFNVPQLPTVVLQNIIENFNPIELVDRKTNENKYDGLGSRCFGDAIVPVSVNENHEIISFWEDPYSGMNTVYFHLSTLFDCPTHSMELYSKIPINVCFSAVDFLCSRQSGVRILTIFSARMNGEDVIRILNRIRCEEEFNIYSEVSNVPENFVIPFEAQSIRVFPAPWITFDHLDSMRNCVSIELWESNLTNEDIQKFIDNWKQGLYPNLQWLHVKSFKFTDNFLISGLETLENTMNPTFVSREMFRHLPRIHGAVRILRNDGVVGLIRYYKGSNFLRLLV
ncbi:unnamed protein product [Caenorhabditis nigoni]